jgi:response regulator RpfG family c-di-GMP phosphodiesterase
MGKSEEEQQAIYYAGVLHDVGKIRIPLSVINKPGKLTKEEFNYIRIHPVSGYNILRDIHDDERISQGAKYHHERYDGKGYPSGLAGENIPEVARILAVADAYDAMASDRSYRRALPQDVIRSEIEKGKGTQFDPAIADIMLQLIDEDKGYEMRQKESGTKNILVVDTDPTNIQAAKEILSKIKSVSVLGADSADTALLALHENDISLILLDITVPGTDGRALYQSIGEESHTPIVIMTSEKGGDMLERIGELNIADYLTKPLNEFITLETVHGILYGNGTKN